MPVAPAAAGRSVGFLLLDASANFDVDRVEELQQQPSAAETRREQRFPYTANLAMNLPGVGVVRCTSRRRVGLDSSLACSVAVADNALGRGISRD